MSDFTRILATTDLSEQARPGVDQAAALARRLGSELVLLMTVEDHLPPMAGAASAEDRYKILESYRDLAAQRLADFAAQNLQGCHVSTIAAIGPASQEIVRYAQEKSVDLIVMASHGYGPIRQLLLGSTAERVLHHAPCPVLIVPSKGG
ncbi:MAG: universal stress protein [Thermoanaerobaculia bacterium]|nr:universal stress protein [Thermoanaerobaculia bacterium]